MKSILNNGRIRVTFISFMAIIIIAVTACKTDHSTGNSSTPTASSLTTTNTPPSQQKVAVPSYFYPGQPWAQMENSVPTVGLAIINPNSGPGKSQDPNYAAQVTNTKAAGITLVGYISTSYAGTHDTTRTLTAAEQDVDNYYRWYPNIGGIFVDEVTTDCDSLHSYYQPLYTYIKSKSSTAQVVLNPGTDTAECYMTASNIIVNFDNTYSQYANWTRPPSSSWISQYPANRFWQIVYNTNQTDMPYAVTLSKKQHAGWVYVTDEDLPNPFDTLPSYWVNELIQVKQS